MTLCKTFSLQDKPWHHCLLQALPLCSDVHAFVCVLSACTCVAGVASFFPPLCLMSLPYRRGATNARCALLPKPSFSAAHRPGQAALSSFSVLRANGMMTGDMRTLPGLSQDLLPTPQWELCLCKEQTQDPSGCGNCVPAPAPVGLGLG